MEYRIVTEPSAKIREIARHVLSGYWKPVVIGVFLYYILSTGVGVVLDYFFSYDYVVPADVYGTEIMTNLTYGGSIYQIIIGGPLEFGMALFLLTFFRSKRADNSLLFEGFSNFGKSFVLMILITVKTFLWSLLFIIPGIIAGIRYSQAFFIMQDNPELTPGQCIKESCRIMNGNKWKLFCLTLSFIGWYLLAGIPQGAFTGASAFMDASGIGTVIALLVTGLPGVIVDAYFLVASVAFYELATRRLVVVEEPQIENQI